MGAPTSSSARMLVKADEDVGAPVRLLRNKLGALQSGKPAQIASANIGCQAHLQSGTDIPVRHWIELIEEALAY